MPKMMGLMECDGCKQKLTPMTLYEGEGGGRMEVIRIVSLIPHKINIIRSSGVLPAKQR